MFKHFVITRFNVGLYDNIKIIDKNQYMKYRIKIFKDIYIESFKKQTCKKFEILIFVDEETPKEFIDEIKNLYIEKINILQVNRTQDKLINLKNKIIEEVNEKYIITTRIDNDDGVSFDFIRKIQENFKEQDFEFLNFSLGYILNLKENKKKGFYKSKQFSNPFISLIEKIIKKN